MPPLAAPQPNAPADTLSLEVAVATRILRSGKISRQLWQWLVAPEKFSDCQLPQAQANLTNSLNEILMPLLAEAHQWERREARFAASWLGAICNTVTVHCDQLKLGVGSRLLAAALLPLYRCLATSQLSEGLRESRMRLSELLALLELCHEIGEDLVQLLEPLNQFRDAPNQILAAQFDLNLVVVAQVVRDFGENFDPRTQQFDQATAGCLLQLGRKSASDKVVEWAAPDLLWKLAGELISQNSELVLPRSWIETPVPWNSLVDHWNKLSLLLRSSAKPEPLGSTNPQTTPETSRQKAASSQPAVTAATEQRVGQSEVLAEEQTLASDEARTLAAVAEMQALLQTTSLSEPTAKRAASPPAAERSEPSAARAPQLSQSDEESLLPQPDQTPTASSPAPTPVLPKVLIAEIRSHNDPVFVNVLSRQIAKCRVEDRAISLVSMVVLPEHGHEHRPVQENGLALWQQRLVNWLADHPHVVEPHAFLTSEGELLLCLLDLERNETTSLVRHGLVEVLTGKQMDESDGSLAKVNIPARYHAGIASTSSPGAGFTAGQLIEPAVRCLSAASRQGTASIKSIEVF